MVSSYEINQRLQNKIDGTYLVCYSCSTQNPEGAVFCKECGKKLDLEAGVPEVIDSPNYTRNTTENSNLDILDVLSVENHLLFFTRNSLVIAKQYQTVQMLHQFYWWDFLPVIMLDPIIKTN